MIRYIDLVNAVTPDLPHLPIADMGPPPLVGSPAPLARSRVMLVTSAGVHYRADPPFQPTNDLTFRLIAQDADPREIRPSHPSPIRVPGRRDINVVFPYRRLAELVERGRVGATTAVHVSFLGAIKRLRALVAETAPGMVAAARDAGADAVLLVPL